MSTSDMLMTMDEYFALVREAMNTVYGFADDLPMHPEDILINAVCVMESMNVAFGEVLRRMRP